MREGLLNLVVCFLISITLSPFLIKWLTKLKFGQSILVYVEKHKTKSGTPTMGGIIIILSTLIGYLLFFRNNNSLATIAILSLLFFGVLGFLDDFIKIKFKQNEGLKPYQKVIGQLGISSLVAVFIYISNLVGTEMYLPFTSKTINVGFWIIPIVIVFFIAVVNSVNLIDGLDGLCSGVSSIVIFALGIIILIMNRSVTDVVSEEMTMLVIVGFGLVGAILGFLLFNSFPAKVFMGDTGSLAIGGFIATMSSFSKNYFLIVFVGLAFVLTSLSVILQVISYKLTRKRIFKMSPLHHHFEHYFHENKVVWWYVILTLVVCVLTIMFYL